jgi:hypothetical protein
MKPRQPIELFDVLQHDMDKVNEQSGDGNHTLPTNITNAGTPPQENER